jgi:uncharacterized membrane protein YhaH (DUF805 family)
MSGAPAGAYDGPSKTERQHHREVLAQSGQPPADPTPGNTPDLQSPGDTAAWIPPAGHNPLSAVKMGFIKYADFSGRASRSEYSYFVLFLLILYGSAGAASAGLLRLAVLATLTPLLAVVARRTHDCGLSSKLNLTIIALPAGAAILMPYLDIHPSGLFFVFAFLAEGPVGILVALSLLLLAGSFLVLSFIAAIELITLAFRSGETGPNRWG